MAFISDWWHNGNPNDLIIIVDCAVFYFIYRVARHDFYGF